MPRCGGDRRVSDLLDRMMTNWGFPVNRKKNEGYTFWCAYKLFYFNFTDSVIFSFYLYYIPYSIDFSYSLYRSK